MTTQELVQRVHQLAEDYNKNHDGQFAINYHNGFYRLIHSDVPNFEYVIDYFNAQNNDIDSIFETLSKLIVIYKALNDEFSSYRVFFQEDCLKLFDKKHQTTLTPLSNQNVAIEQTYHPSLTEISFTKDGVEILLTLDSPYHCINAFYTAKADVSLDKLNDTIEALRKKTQNVL